ncbi:JAB-like toxin 1 domain-containing protein [Aquimarina sp. W85]|uniref:JAB-like toxin 1 domain-containing protein n=1 Tax=Aquimarina rhodophyticola TaxID=3342246 RepID=UPI0036728B02
MTVSKNKDGSSLLSDLTNNNKTETWGTDSEGSTAEIDVDIAVTGEENKNEAFSLFNFASDNSNVEWSIVKYQVYPGGINYQVGTYHLNEQSKAGSYSPGFSTLPTGVTPLGISHSHPGQRTATARAESLAGDRGVSRTYFNKYGNVPYNIYFPDNRTETRMSLPKNPLSRGVIVKNGLRRSKF